MNLVAYIRQSRSGLAYWIISIAGLLSCINLFLYLALYGEDITENVTSKLSSTSSSSAEYVSNGAKSVVETFTNSRGKVDKQKIEEQVSVYLNENKRNKRLKSYFPSKYYEGSELTDFKLANPVIEQFDRRLLPAFWFHLINKHMRSEPDKLLDDNFKLPFNWDMLNNLAAKIRGMKYSEKILKNKMSCKKFRDVSPQNLPQSFLEQFCVTYNYEDPNFPNEYQVPFLVVRKIDQYTKDIEWRKIHGSLYTLTAAEIPRNVLFLSEKSLLVPLKKVSNGHNDLGSWLDSPLESYYSKLADEYVEDKLIENPFASRTDILENGVSLYEEWNLFKNKIAGKSQVKTSDQLTYVPSKPLYLEHSARDPVAPIEIASEAFNFFLPDELSNLETQIKNAPEGEDTRQLEHMRVSGVKFLDLTYNAPKYYGLPSVEGKPLDHYDWRFFNVYTLQEDPELHTAILHRLSRVWMRLCGRFNIPTWMNHGPVIGWYWSGATLPYDYDLDLQMPIQSLHRISKFLNNTLIYDFADEPDYINDDFKIDNKAELGIRSYLLDIDPVYFDRNARNELNDVDARLIDTETGVYIDLTAVSEIHSGLGFNLDEERKFLEASNYRGFRVMVPSHYDQFTKDGEYAGNNVKGCVMKDNLVNEIKKFVNEKKSVHSMAQDSPTRFLDGYAHDKNFHTYKISELSPLLPTVYESYMSYLPANWKKNVYIEYSGDKSLKSKVYNDYRFYEKVMQWVHYNTCPLWSKESGELLNGMNENQAGTQCLAGSPELEKNYRRSMHYSVLHGVHRDQMMQGQGHVVDAKDFTKNVSPFLHKFSRHLLVPEPFVERHLYSE